MVNLRFRVCPRITATPYWSNSLHRLCADIICRNETHNFSEEFQEKTMQISASLNQKIAQAVQTSMRIEGCKPVQSDAVKKQAQALMEQHRIQVSVRRK